MNATLSRSTGSRQRSFLVLGLLAAGVYAIETAAVHSPRFVVHPQLVAAAVAFDLVVVLPFLYWLLVVRRGHAGAATLVPIVIASLLGARLVLPVEERSLLVWGRLLMAPVELGILGYAAVKIRRAARGLRAASHALDVPERLALALHDAFPNPVVGRVLATELTLAFYAFGSWRRAPHVPAGSRPFFYHRRNGLAGLLGALIGASLVELFVVHLLVHARAPRVAWALAALSAFGVVWLLGFARAIVLRPVLVTDDHLMVRGGVQWRLEIARALVERVERARGLRVPAKNAPLYLRGTPIAQPNVLVTLREPVEATGLYGRTKMVRTVSLSLDDAAAFENALA